MVRSLIDLGLRSSEVVKLQLDDFNWVDGTIKLVGTKSRRADALPLPAKTSGDCSLSARGATRDVEPGHICSPCCPLRRADPEQECQTCGAGRLPKMWMDADPCPHAPPQHGEPTSTSRRVNEGDCGHPAASKPRHVCHLCKGRSEQSCSRRPTLTRERTIDARTMFSLAEAYLSERRLPWFRPQNGGPPNQLFRRVRRRARP